MPAIGYVTKVATGGYKGQLKTLSIRADIDLVPNTMKNGDNQPDYRVLTQGIEIGAGWVRTGETSGKEYVSLSLAAPEFGPRRLYANLGRTAGQDDEDTFAAIWNLPDEETWHRRFHAKEIRRQLSSPPVRDSSRCYAFAVTFLADSAAVCDNNWATRP